MFQILRVCDSEASYQRLRDAVIHLADQGCPLELLLAERPGDPKVDGPYVTVLRTPQLDAFWLVKERVEAFDRIIVELEAKLSEEVSHDG